MKKNTSKTKKQTRKVEAPKQRDGKELFASYMGIDLGDKHCEVCVLDQQGEFVKALRLPMKAADLERYLVRIGRSRVAIEAGGQSRWVAEVIERCGHQVFVSNTRKVGYIHQSDDKNDPGDAYKLAELVYFKPRLLHPIQHRSQQAQSDLSWIRAREVLVQARTEVVNAVRGMSKAFGGRLAKCSTEAFTAKLADQIPEAIRSAVAPLLETIDHLNEQIDYYDRMEEKIAGDRYEQHTLLTAVDGVGVHTALSFMLTIGDPLRFAKSRMVGCYVGLRPKQKDSGESQPQLGITKAGDEYLRKTLVNCAHYILGPHGKDSDLRRYGQRIGGRGGKNAKKRAVIAVARKLAVLLHRLWVSGEAYEPLRNSPKQTVVAA
ncbi:MAG TPA: IS110 family transposase [Bryobacteraceae bacterium]|jgi:transposase|nr:IS110 family transposase [Bryobacteraceae bacterium]